VAHGRWPKVATGGPAALVAHFRWPRGGPLVAHSYRWPTSGLVVWWPNAGGWPRGGHWPLVALWPGGPQVAEC